MSQGSILRIAWDQRGRPAKAATPSSMTQNVSRAPRRKRAGAFNLLVFEMISRCKRAFKGPGAAETADCKNRNHVVTSVARRAVTVILAGHRRPRS